MLTISVFKEKKSRCNIKIMTKLRKPINLAINDFYFLIFFCLDKDD